MHAILPFGVLFEAKDITEEEVAAVEQECRDMIEQIRAGRT